jgi:hypothetical protein
VLDCAGALRSFDGKVSRNPVERVRSRLDSSVVLAASRAAVFACSTV